MFVVEICAEGVRTDMVEEGFGHPERRQPATSLDLFTDSIRAMGDATMVSVLVFDRPLDIRRLERAVSRCFDAYPILSSKLVRGHGPAYWEVQCWDESWTKVPVMDIGASDYRRYTILGVDPHASPQARFRVLRSPHRDALVINLAHAAADGSGLKELTRTLMTAYLDPESIKRSDGSLPERDTLWTAALLEEEELPPDDGVELIKPMWPSPCRPSRAPSTFHRVVIDAQGVEAIRDLAHRHGGTANDVLMAAYFLSLSDLTGHLGPQSVFFPVDLRRYLGNGSRAMSNQAVNVHFTLTRTSREGMDTLLDKVVAETARMKGGRIGIREQVAFDRGCDPQGVAVHRMVQEMVRIQEQEGLADIFISNTGALDLPPVDGLVDAYIAYPGLHMPATCFVVSTFRGAMTVTMCYQDEDGPREATRRAMQGFLGHLPVQRHLTLY